MASDEPTTSYSMDTCKINSRLFWSIIVELTCFYLTDKGNVDKEGSGDDKEDLYLKFKILIGLKRCLPDKPQQVSN